MKKRTCNLIAAALFVTVLFSFTVFHLTNAATLSGRGDLPADYDGGTFEGDSLFGRFYRGVYQNKNALQTVRRASYDLFGAVNTDRVVVGKNGFLFPVTDETNGYNYIADYLGLSLFTEEEERAVLDTLLARQALYRERGAAYLLVVLPANQTLYGEQMPAYLGRGGDETRLSHLCAMLEENGFDYCMDVSGALLEAKEDGVLCDNTENALNALGMYYTYRTVLDRFVDSTYQAKNVVAREYVTFYRSNTEGRELARLAGLDGILQNRTVLLRNDSYYGYRVLFNTGFAARTVRLPEDYSTLPPDSMSVLLQFTNSRDRLLIEPYFSNTFDYVTYQTDLSDNADVYGKAAPNVVIQFIRENELSLLLPSQ